MPLIDSTRLTDDDRAAWRLCERLDTVNQIRIGRRPNQAMNDIARFLDQGPASVAVSWGKDSVVVADLALRVNPELRLWHCTTGGRRGCRENPEIGAVRDRFLEIWPTVDYREYDGRDVDDQLAAVNRSYEPRSISGVRAAESPDRAMSAAVHGIATARFCRPILRWPTWAVFGYVHLRDLPLCSVYGMTRGGVLDRDHLRTHSIGGPQGVASGRREWERAYFPDLLGVALVEQDEDRH